MEIGLKNTIRAVHAAKISNVKNLIITTGIETCSRALF
jgi:hypothetical protein